jgi:DNA-binding PadR family transcriptional regulator
MSRYVSRHGFHRGDGECRHAHGLDFGRHRAGRQGHGDRGRGGRGGRVFEHGDLRYLLLHLIAERPCHGYELIKAIEERFGGGYSPSPGAVYPTLTLLEELGYIQPEAAEGSRKRFSATPSGTAFLAANQAIVDAVLGRMDAASRAQGGEPAPEIRRALRNLEVALSIRLGRGPLDGEAARGVATVLDHAAAAIEQS